jgi:hypothetical protein
MKRILFLLIMVLPAALPVMAQEAPVFQPLDYVDALGASYYLYPEAAYTWNPSVLLSLDHAIVMPNLSFYGYGYKDAYTHTDPLQDTYGGTYVDEYTSLTPSLALTGALPLGNSMIVGGKASFSTGLAGEKQTWTNYDYFDESQVTSLNTSSYSYEAAGTFCMKLGMIALGATVDYSGYFAPGMSAFPVTTNPDNASVPYYGTSAVTRTDALRNSVTPTIGMGITLGNLWCGLGVSGSYSLTDQSAKYRTVDEDGDGYYETVMPYSQWALSTEAWGGGYTYYSNVNTSTIYSLTLYPAVTFRLNPSLSLIADGYWTALNRTAQVRYERFSQDDLSDREVVWDSGLANFEVFLGVNWQPVKQWDFRVGTGYSYFAQHYQVVKSVGPDGTSTFNEMNVNNYPEFNSGGSDPANGIISSLSAGNPQFQDTHTIPLLISVEWYPVGTIMIFSYASAALQFTAKHYFGFDTYYEQVWEEVDRAIEPYWNMWFATGLSISLSKSLLFSIATYSTTSDGDYRMPNDSLPISEEGFQSENGSADLHNYSPWSFYVQAFFTLKL